MVAAAGGTDVLLAYPLVGPNIEAVRPPRPRLPRHDVPRHGRSTPTRRGRSPRRGGPRPPVPGPGRPRGRHGPDRDRPRRGGGRALCADRPAAEPGRRRPARLRRPDPRHRRRRARAKPTQDRDRATSGAARPALKRGHGRPPAGAGRDADLPDPRRAGHPGRRVLAGDVRAPRRRLRTRYPDLPFTPAALLLTPRDQPPATRPALPRPRPQGRRRRPGRPAAPIARHRRRHGRSPTARSTSSSRPPTPTSSRPARRSSPSRPTSARPCALHRRAYVIEDGELVDGGRSRPAIGSWAFDGQRQKGLLGRVRPCRAILILTQAAAGRPASRGRRADVRPRPARGAAGGMTGTGRSGPPSFARSGTGPVHGVLGAGVGEPAPVPAGGPAGRTGGLDPMGPVG